MIKREKIKNDLIFTLSRCWDSVIDTGMTGREAN